FLTPEVPGARLLVRIGSQGKTVIADDEGFFDVRLDLSEPLSPDRTWHEVSVEVLWPHAPGQEDHLTTGEVLAPQERASFGIISDIDDTILRTEATSILRMLRLVMLSNAHTRLPFEGVGAFYRALRDGADEKRDNPVFYVSTGPWNFYDLLSHFLELQRLPTGPIFLKDWGGLKDVLRGMDHLSHKLEVIRNILKTHPDLSFVLVGDSGQQDAEVYGQVAREFPERVRAIYIRDVKGEVRAGAVNEIADSLRALNVPMLLVPDTVAAAKHASANGLISPNSLPAIRERRAEDADANILKEGAAIIEHLSQR
ncbi:MAG: App1 family protein, partial [Rubrobacteraceae bacterium]